MLVFSGHGSYDLFHCLFVSEHPGAGGIRFNLPKRQKTQQNNQNNFNPQNPARFNGPRGPHPQGHQNQQQQGPEKINEEQLNGNNNEKSEMDPAPQAK